MKKLCFPVLALFYISLAACNSSTEKDKPTSDTTAQTPKTPADSLMSDVMEGHDESMAKMGRLDGMQKEVQKVLDSIATLPAKSKAAMAPLKKKMEAVLVDLKKAKSDMDDWMARFNMDSAVNNMEQRIKYLRDEKWRITAVRENILHSLQKADSLVKAKL